MRHKITLVFLLASAQMFAQRFVQEFRTERNDRAVAVQQVENKEYIMLNQRFGLADADSFGINLTKMSGLARQRWSRDLDFDFPVQAGDLSYWPERNAYLLSASSAVDTVQDNIVAMINILGNPIWTYRWGSSAAFSTPGARTKILPVSDSEFVVAAGSSAFSTTTFGNDDLLLARFDQDGQVIWERRYCFSCLGFDALLGDLLQTSDGGFLIGGGLRDDTKREALLVKTDSDGQINWVRSYAADSTLTTFELSTWNLAEPKQDQYLWTGNYFDQNTLIRDGVFALVNNSDTIPFATRWNLSDTAMDIRTLDLLLRDTSGKGQVVIAGSAVDNTLPADAREYNFLAAVTADSMQQIWAKDYFPEANADFTTHSHALTSTVDDGLAYFISIDTQMVNSNAVLIKTDPNGVTGCEEDLSLRRDSLHLVMTALTVQVLDLSDADTIELKDEQPFTDITPTMEGLQITGGGGLSCEPIMDTLNAAVEIYVPGQVSSYLWSTGENTAEIIAMMDGQFTVEVSSDAMCFYLPDTTTINILPPPMGTVSINADSLCEEEQVILIANGTPVFEYMWSTGSIQPVDTVDAIGTYTVTMTNSCGSITLPVEVTRVGCICNIIFPNAFTPDGDSNNDRFQPVAPCTNFTEFQLFVYSRWGEEVFQTTSQSDGWNGEHNGNPAPSDVYAWYAMFTSPEGERITMKGDVTLLR